MWCAMDAVRRAHRIRLIQTTIMFPNGRASEASDGESSAKGFNEADGAGKHETELRRNAPTEPLVLYTKIASSLSVCDRFHMLFYLS